MISAIIGGTGIYDLSELEVDIGHSLDLKKERVKTPYGEVTLERNDTVVFLNRHAPKHSTPPHKINYRANMKALNILGVKRVCSTFAVGSINKKFELGVPIILDDFIDFSSGRDHTFFDTLNNSVGHVEMSTPFCPVLSNSLEKEADTIGLKVKRGGVYASVNGPRFETPAEIRAFRMLGADVVGMTLCPELPLANELGMSYAGLAFSINWGSGMKDTIEFVGEEAGIKEKQKNMLRIMLRTLANTHDKQCASAKLL